MTLILQKDIFKLVGIYLDSACANPILATRVLYIGCISSDLLLQRKSLVVSFLYYTMAESLISTSISAAGSESGTINVLAQGNVTRGFSVSVTNPSIGFIISVTGAAGTGAKPLPKSWFVVAGSSISLPVGTCVVNSDSSLIVYSYSMGTISLSNTTFAYSTSSAYSSYFYYDAGMYLVLG